MVVAEDSLAAAGAAGVAAAGRQLTRRRVLTPDYAQVTTERKGETPVTTGWLDLCPAKYSRRYSQLSFFVLY